MFWIAIGSMAGSSEGAVAVCSSYTGTISGRYDQTVDSFTCQSATTQMGTTLGSVAGSSDAAGLHLSVTPRTNSPPTLGPCPDGSEPTLIDDPLTVESLNDLLATLAPQANKRYSSSIDVTVPLGDSTVDVRATITLSPLDADPVDAAAVSATPAVPPA